MSVKDKLGNQIKVGQLVNVDSTSHGIICEVVEIKEPSVLAPGKDAMHMPGMIFLISKHAIPYDPRQGAMSGMVVVQTPLEGDGGKPN